MSVHLLRCAGLVGSFIGKEELRQFKGVSLAWRREYAGSNPIDLVEPVHIELAHEARELNVSMRKDTYFRLGDVRYCA